MDAFRLVVSVAVAVAVVVAVLLFERRRAEQIRRDTGRMAQGHPDVDGDEEDPPRGGSRR